MDELEGKLNALFSSPESMDKIMQLAKSLSGSSEAPRTAEPSVPDARLMGILSSAMSEFSSGGDTERLAAALKPFLSPERAERLDRAVGVARIARVARRVIPELGGDGGIV